MRKIRNVIGILVCCRIGNDFRDYADNAKTIDGEWIAIE